MRQGFTFYVSYYEALEDLSVDEKWKIIDMVSRYMFYGEVPDKSQLQGSAKLAFKLIEPTLKKSQILSENGKKGGGQKGNQNARKYSKENEQKTSKNEQKTSDISISTSTSSSTS